jgi:oxygen-independent coproporphyrinogen-3 oxidase
VAEHEGLPAGVYVHVPFCSAVCPYCDFAVVRRRGHDLAAFVGRLQREIRQVRAGWVVDTIYFGGGTPSALAPQHLAQVLATLREAVDVAADARIHLEVNPEDVEASSLQAWRELGVVFLSLGIQSFDDRRLKLLGRRHRREQAELAVSLALGAGFDTVSVDVIYALPGDGPGGGLADFERAAALGVQHISGYELTVKEGTPFARWRDRGGLIELDEDTQAQLLIATHERLAVLGFEGYEVSNFARGPQHRSAHNQKYWRHQPYLGFGPSAHSFDGRERWWNHRSLVEWGAAIERDESPAAGREVIGPEERLLEVLMLGLRTSDGVDLASLGRQLGGDFERPLAAAVERLVLSQHVGIVDGRLRPSLSGMALADRLAVDLAAAFGLGEPVAALE